jgi:hypothetical protein
MPEIWAGLAPHIVTISLYPIKWDRFAIPFDRMLL